MTLSMRIGRARCDMHFGIAAAVTVQAVLMFPQKCLTERNMLHKGCQHEYSLSTASRCGKPHHINNLACSSMSTKTTATATVATDAAAIDVNAEEKPAVDAVQVIAVCNEPMIPAVPLAQQDLVRQTAGLGLRYFTWQRALSSNQANLCHL